MLSIVLATSVLFGIETFWRSAGYKPTLVDDWKLWCTQRENVETAPPNTLLMIGHSRIHQAFVPSVFNEELPNQRFVQLGIFNAEPVPNFVDIAENTDFNGTIVCSVLAYCLLEEFWMPTDEDPYCDDLVRYYHSTWGIKDKTDRLVSNYFQDRLALMSPKLTLHKAMPDVLRGEWPSQYVWTESDRTQIVEYDRTDLVAQTDRQLRWLKMIVDNRVKSESYEQWPSPQAFEKLNEYVDKVQDRGGHVVFLRTVTTGVFGEKIAELFPREKFWDVFAANTNATTIHYEDVPEIAEMVCADGSHLYHNDALKFTRALARELQRRELINDGASASSK